MPNLFPLKAVIDSCVFPHTRKWSVPISDLAQDGYVHPIWSPTILAESHRTLTWLWLKRNGGVQTDASWKRLSKAAKFVFSEATRVYRVVDDHPPMEAVWTDNPADEWDIHLWTSAIRSEAQFIVTDNTDDGPPKGEDGIREFQGIYWMHPDTFLALVSQLIHLWTMGAVAETKGSAVALPEFWTAASRTLGVFPLTAHPSFREFVATCSQRQSWEE